jgi:hypothetical protein
MEMPHIGAAFFVSMAGTLIPFIPGFIYKVVI